MGFFNGYCPLYNICGLKPTGLVVVYVMSYARYAMLHRSDDQRRRSSDRSTDARLNLITQAPTLSTSRPALWRRSVHEAACFEPQLTSHPSLFVEMAVPQGLTMDLPKARYETTHIEIYARKEKKYLL
jgi:hypothetical protein